MVPNPVLSPGEVGEQVIQPNAEPNAVEDDYTEEPKFGHLIYSFSSKPKKRNLLQAPDHDHDHDHDLILVLVLVLLQQVKEVNFEAAEQDVEEDDDIEQVQVGQKNHLEPMHLSEPGEW